jgi:phosphoglycolate phosphatase
MKPVDLMVFDLDGTLVTSGKDIAASVNHTLQVLELPGIEERIILEYIGDGVKKLIERSLGPLAHVRFEQALAIFSKHYDEHMLDNTMLYPGVVGVLVHFQDKKKVVLTNKRHRFAAAMCDALKLTQYFDEVVGADSTPYIKPDPRMIVSLLRRFDTKPDRAVIIGDGVNDILLAKHAGILSCAYLNGLTASETLLSLEPDYSCVHLSEIKDLFC